MYVSFGESSVLYCECCISLVRNCNDRKESNINPPSDLPICILIVHYIFQDNGQKVVMCWVGKLSPSRGVIF